AVKSAAFVVGRKKLILDKEINVMEIMIFLIMFFKILIHSFYVGCYILCIILIITLLQSIKFSLHLSLITIHNCYHLKTNKEETTKTKKKTSVGV
ncbi:MAG: hypothetical protein ACI8WT_004729, partial [Clostridium sp.]